MLYEIWGENLWIIWYMYNVTYELLQIFNGHCVLHWDDILLSQMTHLWLCSMQTTYVLMCQGFPKGTPWITCCHPWLRFFSFQDKFSNYKCHRFDYTTVIYSYYTVVTLPSHVDTYSWIPLSVSVICVLHMFLLQVALMWVLDLINRERFFLTACLDPLMTILLNLRMLE